MKIFLFMLQNRNINEEFNFFEDGELGGGLPECKGLPGGKGVPIHKF